MIIKKYGYLDLFLCAFWMVCPSATDEKSMLTEQVFEANFLSKYGEYLFMRSSIENLVDLSTAAQRIIDTDAKYRKAIENLLEIDLPIIEDLQNEINKDFQILKSYWRINRENPNEFAEEKLYQKSVHLDILHKNIQQFPPHRIYPEDANTKQNYLRAKHEREKAFNAIKESKLEEIKFYLSLPMNKICTDFNKNFRKKLFSDCITEYYRKELDMHIREDMLIEDNTGRLKEILRQINLYIQNIRENKPLKDWDFDPFRMIYNICSRCYYDIPDNYVELFKKKMNNYIKIVDSLDKLETMIFEAREQCANYSFSSHSPDNETKWIIEVKSDWENNFEEAILFLNIIREELQK